MVGRAALIYVIGFATILAFISLNMNRFATESVGNMAMYYDLTTSHNLAEIGANVGLAELTASTAWRGPINQNLSDDPILKGSYTVSAFGINSNKYLVVQCISSYNSPAAANIFGSSTLHDTVEVTMDTSSINYFTMFAWMTNSENGVWWTDKDTLWGRFHSNGTINVDGHPYFEDKVTTATGFETKPGTGKNQGVYHNGYETGVDKVKLPADMSGITSAVANTNRATSDYGVKNTNGGNMWVTLGKNPTSGATKDGWAFIQYQSGSSGSGVTTPGTVKDSIQISGNSNFDGVIYGDHDVYVSGVLDGSLTIGAGDDIHITDDITYKVDPTVTPTSDDMLGLVANDDVIVDDNAANNADCTIQGALMVINGSFTAANYDSRVVSGKLQILGSIVQKDRGGVGTFTEGTHTINHGFSKRYRYDDRFSDPTVRPPKYPGFSSPTFAIRDWWENTRWCNYK